MKTKIAIVGYGFVGKAVEFGFRNNTNDILIVDPHKGYNYIEDVYSFQPNFVFVCVPTPMGADGSINSSIITEVSKEILNMVSSDCVVIIKSTVTPDIISKLCVHKHFVYN